MNPPRAVLAAYLVLFAAAALAQEAHPAPGRGAPDVPAGDAAVVGRLSHASGPEAVAQTDVLLYAMSPDGSGGLRRGRTNEKGEFRFDGVSNAPDLVYLVGARLREVPFGTRFQFRAGEREHRVQLAVSDAIADASRAAAAGVEIRVDRGCTHLRVAHRHTIQTRGDRAVFVPPAERATAVPIFEVELPAEAEGFEAIAGGEGLVRDGRRVRFWGPAYPEGEQTIEFGYGMPLATASFAVGFPSGAPAPTVLAPQGVVAISSDALRAAPGRTLDEQHYAAQRGVPITAGGSLALAVQSLAPAATPVRTPRALLQLELDDAALEVEQHIEVIADGEGAPLTSPATPLLCIPMPENASELRFSSDTFAAGLRRDPSGDLAIHGPLPRGTTQLAMSYRLPATSAGASLAQSFDRVVPLLTVLVADNGVVTETPRLHRRQSARMDERTFLHLEAFAVEPGEVIDVGLRRTPPAAARGRAAPAGFALLAGLAAFGFLLHPLRGRPEGSAAAPEADVASLERTAIVRSLEALDEDLETGKLSAEDHAAMRTELRARAAALLLAPPAVGRESDREPSRSEPKAGEDHRVGERIPPRAEGAPESAAEHSPAARFCSACGSAVRPTDAFCSQCGTRLARTPGA
jgi:hypothetical protein